MESTVKFGDANSGFQAGVINGPVNTQFHHYAPPERPETPPDPSAIIPFSRDPDFVEHGTILDQVSQSLAQPGSRAALVGLGGVGKSQISIEYAYRTRERSPGTWVFWVHASNAARFEQSFRDMASYIKIPGRQDPQANIFQLMHDWLRDERKGKWVLILDNIDDNRFLLDSTAHQDARVGGSSKENSRPLISYLPQCQNGVVLITTRSSRVALDLVEHPIEVGPMNTQEAVSLMKKKLGKHADTGNITDLVILLEHMPLAIVQAASYISQRAPRSSVQKYTEDFQRNDRKKQTLLDYEGGQLRRDREAKNSIIVTWQISFDHIRQARPSAANLLSLMSFCDRQGIPEYLVRSRSEEKELQQTRNPGEDTNDNGVDDNSDSDTTSQSSSTDGFEDDILILRNYSFISVSGNETFEMHRLVQLATKKWLEANKQLETWKQQFLKNLDKNLPTGNYENWSKCQELFPHAHSAKTEKPKEDNLSLHWASILYKAAWYAERMGNSVDAEQMSIHAMKIRKKVLGEKDINTLAAMGAVLVVYMFQGRWDAAEKLGIQVMKAFKEKLGPDHPHTLISMGNMAIIYRTQGRWDAAEELGIQVMKARKEKLGPDHPDTLISMGNLATIYMLQGRWDAAEELGIQVMKARKEKLGPDHPHTLISMGDLATIYRNQGRWDAAEELGIQVMKAFKEKLGPDHPDTLTSMNNLALVWKTKGRDTEALNLLRECTELRRQKLGPNHPHSLVSFNTLIQWDEGEKGRFARAVIDGQEDLCNE